MVCAGGARGMGPARAVMESPEVLAHADTHPVTLFYLRAGEKASNGASAAYVGEWSEWREGGAGVVPCYGAFFDDGVFAVQSAIAGGAQGGGKHESVLGADAGKVTVLLAGLEREETEALLKGVIVEFRQDNMFQHFSQFQTACELIANKGGSVAIDNVQTETLGVVNLHRLKVKMAKIMWHGDAVDDLMQAKDDIRAMQEGGTVMVLAHVDDEQAVKIGQSLGINLFQGYHVDKLLAGGGAGKGGA